MESRGCGRRRRRREAHQIRTASTDAFRRPWTTHPLLLAPDTVACQVRGRLQGALRHAFLPVESWLQSR